MHLVYFYRFLRRCSWHDCCKIISNLIHYRKQSVLLPWNHRFLLKFPRFLSDFRSHSSTRYVPAAIDSNGKFKPAAAVATGVTTDTAPKQRKEKPGQIDIRRLLTTWRKKTAGRLPPVSLFHHQSRRARALPPDDVICDWLATRKVNNLAQFFLHHLLQVCPLLDCHEIVICLDMNWNCFFSESDKVTLKRNKK